MYKIIVSGIISVLLFVNMIIPNYNINDNIKFEEIEETTKNFEEVETIIIETEETIEETIVEETIFETIVETEETVEEEIVEETNTEEVIEETICSEYEVANIIWNNLKDFGFNDYVCAGIVGNMMVECGGQTLDLQYDIYSYDGYYGLCQWGDYYPEVHGTDLIYQINFLLNNIDNEFDMFSDAFNFSYNDFVNLENEQESAIMFAKIYERCDPSSYELRQECASIAYNYFVG